MNTAGTQITLLDLHEVNFDTGNGLLPAVVQHAASATVLMVGYMNREAPDDPMAFLARLEEVIGVRMATRPDGSYTAKLLASGSTHIAQKVGEEGIEAALAGAGGSDHEVIEEVSDLLYHVMVMLRARGLTLERVTGELKRRHANLHSLAGSPPGASPDYFSPAT